MKDKIILDYIAKYIARCSAVGVKINLQCILAAIKSFEDTTDKIVNIEVK